MLTYSMNENCLGDIFNSEGIVSHVLEDCKENGDIYRSDVIRQGYSQDTGTIQTYI